MSYCVKCGGTGKLLNGDICECSLDIHDLYSDVVCLEVPEQYRNIRFNEALVNDSWNGSYRTFLRKVHTDISTLVDKGHNYLICSPPRRSKTIFAYSTITRLFKAGVVVFPVLDVLELKQKINDHDLGRRSLDDEYDIADFFKAPYVFVKIPPTLSPDVFQMCSLILDRRVRKGHSTIFLFNGSWRRILAADTYENFTPYQGDGNLCTFSIHSWEEHRTNET